MSKRPQPKPATVARKTILIAMAVAVMLILDLLLANFMSMERSTETLSALFLIEGLILILAGALHAVTGSDTPRDVLLRSRVSLRGKPIFGGAPIREGYAGKKMTSAELMIDVAIVIIGAILILASFVVR